MVLSSGFCRFEPMLSFDDRCHPDFCRHLSNYELPALEEHDGAIVGVWPDLRVGYANPAWTGSQGNHQARGETWPLDSDPLQSLAHSHEEMVRQNLERALQSGRPWQQVLRFGGDSMISDAHWSAFPLRNAMGLLIVQSQRVESDPADEGALHERYFTQDGLLVQCFHCRRCRRGHDEHAWDWVSHWVKQVPPQTSHGMCPICFSFYYTQRDVDEEPPQPFGDVSE